MTAAAPKGNWMNPDHVVVSKRTGLIVGTFMGWTDGQCFYRKDDGRVMWCSPDKIDVMERAEVRS